MCRKKLQSSTNYWLYEYYSILRMAWYTCCIIRHVTQWLCILKLFSISALPFLIEWSLLKFKLHCLILFSVLPEESETSFWQSLNGLHLSPWSVHQRQARDLMSSGHYQGLRRSRELTVPRYVVPATTGKSIHQNFFNDIRILGTLEFMLSNI